MRVAEKIAAGLVAGVLALSGCATAPTLKRGPEGSTAPTEVGADASTLPSQTQAPGRRVSTPTRAPEPQTAATPRPADPPPLLAAPAAPPQPFLPQAVQDLETEATPPGLPIPKRPEVQAVIDEFSGPRRRTFDRALERSEPYLPIIKEALEAEGLPEELAYLPLVESHFQPDARSPAGALGLWQFMAPTARACGLRVDWWVDERLDPIAATSAAVRHLSELYERFGDWELALAAYNAGAGAVSRAMERHRAGGFWDLCEGGGLRQETRRYVPKFYATAAIAREAERYGFRHALPTAELPYDTLWVDSPVDLQTAARFSGASLRQLRELNPALRRDCTPPGSDAYPLRVPAGKGPSTAARIRAVPPEERLTFTRHTVRSGDSLWSLARRYGTSHRAIAELNHIRDPRSLRLNQDLVVPVRGGAKHAPASRGVVASRDGRPVHVVRPGETVWGISRNYGVSVAAIKRWNALGRRALLHPGDRLVVGPGPARGSRTADARFHVVSRGETLWAISRRYGLSLEDLVRRNSLDLNAVLRPGDRLVVGDAGRDPS